MICWVLALIKEQKAAGNWSSLLDKSCPPGAASLPGEVTDLGRGKGRKAGGSHSHCNFHGCNMFASHALSQSDVGKELWLWRPKVLGLNSNSASYSL